MKKLGFVIVFAMFCNSISFSQSTWQIVDPPVSEDFVSVCFTDEAHGWLISQEGALIKTMDGGITWTPFFAFPGIFINSIYFSDDNHGCIVGWLEIPSDSSFIAITNNGGDDWMVVEHQRINRLNDVFFANNDIGWAVGGVDEWNMNCCLGTTDGGQTWLIQESILVAGAELFGVHFRDENTGQSCGADGAFLLTNNGGFISWALGISMPLINLNAIYNFGTQGGCIVGDDGTVLYTINNWYQYIEQNSNTIENLNGVSGNASTNEVWAVGDNGTIIYTSNYLLGWITQISGVTENLNDICILSSTEGWTVGDNGTILQFTEPSSIDNKFIQNINVFPNPVGDLLFVMSDNQEFIQEIQFYSSTGRLVYQKNANDQAVIEIDVSNMAAGVYLLKVMCETNTITEKILVK